MKLSAVLVLLRIRFPSTIVRRVTEIVVNAAKRQSRRFFAHVGKKVLETVEPALANFDASTSVILKSFNIRIVTAGFHVDPRLECPRPSPTSGVPMLEIQATSQIPFETSARSSVPTQACAANDNLVAAYTATLPVGSPIGAVREA